MFSAPARNAYAAPRKMIPIAAMNSGTASVEAIDPNACGYAVQKTVRTKISQTWLASQTGPIAWWAYSRISHGVAAAGRSAVARSRRRNPPHRARRRGQRRTARTPLAALATSLTLPIGVELRRSSGARARRRAPRQGRSRRPRS